MLDPLAKLLKEFGGTPGAPAEPWSPLPAAPAPSELSLAEFGPDTAGPLGDVGLVTLLDEELGWKDGPENVAGADAPGEAPENVDGVVAGLLEVAAAFDPADDAAEDCAAVCAPIPACPAPAIRIT